MKGWKESCTFPKLGKYSSEEWAKLVDLSVKMFPDQYRQETGSITGINTGK